MQTVLREGDSADTRASRGSVRVPVSVRMTRGSSLKRRVLAGIEQRANTPRPPLGEVRTSIRVPIVSGTRRGGSSEKVEYLIGGSKAEELICFGLDVAIEIVEIVGTGVVTPMLWGFGGDGAMILVGSEVENISSYSQASDE
ncbi:hypothetical protein NHQ30_003271 [Ciborinia camelliae]|nr:hypothetical protein NHQ30_003271 [Ciborinia camelliae]